jgi:hypothetical protein
MTTREISYQLHEGNFLFSNPNAPNTGNSFALLFDHEDRFTLKKKPKMNLLLEEDDDVIDSPKKRKIPEPTENVKKQKTTKPVCKYGDYYLWLCVTNK